MSVLGLMNTISQLNVYQFKDGSQWEFLNPILSVLGAALIPILILVGTAGMIYAIVLGVKLAKSDEQNSREKAKKDLIGAIVGFVLIFVLIVALKIALPILQDWVQSQII